MKLFLLRHGAADWPGWQRPDDERPLTESGKEEVARVAQLLRALEIQPTIISSPLPRARQTAVIAARALETKVVDRAELRPGFGEAEFADLLQEFADNDLLLVGHEPDFTSLIERLTGAKTKLSKAGVAMIKLNREKEAGELRWLIPPKLATASFT